MIGEPGATVNQVTMNGDASRLVVGSSTGKVYRLNSEGKLTWTIDAAADAPADVAQRSVTGLAMNLDGSRFFAGFTDDQGTEAESGVLSLFDDSPLKFWSVAIEGAVIGAGIADDGKGMVAGSTDGNVYSLNLNGAIRWKLETPTGAGQPVNVGAISSDGTRSAAGSNAGEFFLLNLEATKIWAQTTDGPVNDVAVSLNGNRTSAGTVSGSVYIVNNQGAVIKQISHPETSITSLAINSSGSKLIAGTADGRVFAFNSQGTMNWEVFIGGSVTSVALNTSGNKIAASSGNTVYLLSGDGP